LQIYREDRFERAGLLFLCLSQKVFVKLKNRFIMKRIEAIIRRTRFEDVKEALLQSDINWFEYHSVHGIGQSRQERIYRGVQYSTDVIERIALTIICRDIFVEPTIEVLLREAHTGEVGDGRIFVSDVIDTWSIRTGEHGDTVLRDRK
jgi:nitrogen regulatory protein P-II 1